MLASHAIELPPFDTGQYEDCEFVMSGGGAILTLRVAEMRPLGFQFKKVRWHQFTALYNCSSEMVRDAYFRLVEYPNSPAVRTFIEQDRANGKAYARLSHYRIFLDETGCHEVYAESAAAI
jgi:hypothetical protein